MNLSILIPCHNERSTIALLLRSVRTAPLPLRMERREIIVTDDASTDGTSELLRRELGSTIDHLVRHDRPQGKGSAIRSGLRVSSGHVLIIQDADLEYDPTEYSRLLEPILSGRVDAVFGIRRWNGDGSRKIGVGQRLGNQLLTFASNRFTGLGLSDVACGHKAFRRTVLERLELEENGFGIDVELAAKVARLGFGVEEVEVSYRRRSRAEGKKLRLRDGVRAVYAVAKYGLRR